MFSLSPGKGRAKSMSKVHRSIGEYTLEGEGIMTYRLALAVLVVVGWANITRAQPASLDRPTKLRVTGTLLPVEEKQRDDIVTVNILVQDKPLLLRVGKVEELTHTEREQAVKWGVLLREVRFYGPDDLIGPLQQPEIVGKVLMIEGQLDTKARQFLVTAVKKASEDPGSKQPPLEKK